MRILVQGQESEPIPRAKVNSIPYATVAAKIGRGPRALLILGRAEGGERHWFSADRTVLVTQQGRIVRTAGLAANLKHTRLLDDDPLAALTSPGRPLALRRLLDLTPPDRYGVMVRSELEARGRETIEIAELTFETDVYRERCSAREMEWDFENLYWADPDHGLIWKSLQHFHPSVPPVDLEVLKPPGN